MNILILATFITFLMIISMTDIHNGMIYDKVLIPMAIVAFSFDLANMRIDINEAVTAACISGLLMLIIQRLSHGGLGGGDVKFAFVLGLWLGIEGALTAIFIAIITGLIFGIILSIKRRKLKIKMPFGPFMSLGALIVFLYSFAV